MAYTFYHFKTFVTMVNFNFKRDLLNPDVLKIKNEFYKTINKHFYREVFNFYLP